ncbi:MAG: DUF368 domain-containing protein [Rikenellaceae bacterium]
MKNRTITEYLILTLKGMAMGAADVVPGVSGGTIAFITGIYTELINSIKSVNLATIKLLVTFQFGKLLKAVNAPFLAALFLGVGISVFSLARVITYLLEHHPILVWSFFLGLIIASSYSMSKEVKSWKLSSWISFIVGVAFAYYITVATPAQTPESLPFIFLCGAIAICAMILPGISGSFILLLMGKYHHIMDAIKSLDLTIIAVFGAGAAIGIVLFSNVLSFLLSRYKDITIALLTGIMVGSINKVWPWKEIYMLNDVEMTRNIAPNELILPAIGLMILGAVLVLAMEYIARLSSKTE